MRGWMAGSRMFTSAVAATMPCRSPKSALSSQPLVSIAPRRPIRGLHSPTTEEPGFEEADQLYIDPEECIDCDACVEACPVDAITPEDMVPPEWHAYIERNAAYYRRART